MKTLTEKHQYEQGDLSRETRTQGRLSLCSPRRTFLKGSAAIATTLLMLPQPSWAQAWFSCLVVRAGPADDGNIYIWLRDQAQPAAFDHWFRAHDSLKREMLATALTAISTGFPVDANLAATAQYSVVNRLYIRR